VYEDAALSTPHDHPVEADGNGRWPAVFLSFGDYKQTLKTAGGTTLSSIDNIPNPEPFDDTFTLDETAIYNTGDLILMFKNGTRSGAVRCNGRTIGNAASGATERANADTLPLFTFIWDGAANGQAAVSGGRGASAAADYGANKTIALPDYRNAQLIGFGDMGSTDAGLAASAPVVSGSPILAGSIIGENTHVLVTGELASHTHTGTTATESAHTHTGTTNGPNTFHTHPGTTAAGGSHSHTVSGGTVGGQTTTSNVTLAGGGATTVPTSAANILVDVVAAHTHTFTTGNDDGLHTHGFTSAAGSAHSHTFTSAASGSGTAHNNLSRAIPITVLMKL
jgi:hypothetical protein